MKNREMVMCAQTFNRAKSRVAGMYLSEKLDGMRALWLPATAGVPVKDIPFANVLVRKDMQTVDTKKAAGIATGLWSRYGNVIHAPPNFLIGFPPFPLDGELWIGRKTFQQLMATVRDDVPTESKWEHVRYMVIDAPRYENILRDGRINNSNYKTTILWEHNRGRLNLDASPTLVDPTIRGPLGGKINFEITYRELEARRKSIETRYLRLHKQVLLPFNGPQALDLFDAELEKVTDGGGEGLILRHPTGAWEPVRSEFLLKVKKLHDAEGIIVGFKAGEGKYLGMIGSIRVRMGNVEFDLSGFTDDERELYNSIKEWAVRHPGGSFDALKPVSVRFAIGDTITFRYRELSDEGVPKEARYLRKAILET